MEELKQEKASSFQNVNNYYKSLFKRCALRAFFYLNINLFMFYILNVVERAKEMNPIKIGLAGLGNVGEEVAYQLINGFRVQNDLFPIELKGVSAKSKGKKRKINLSSVTFFDDAVSMA